MTDKTTHAAILLAVAMVISSWIFHDAMTSLGESIHQAAVDGKPQAITVPDRIYLETKSSGPTQLILQSSGGGVPIKVEVIDGDK